MTAAQRAGSAGFGLLMVAAAGVTAPPLAVPALAAVLVGLRFRRAAVPAVLGAAAAIAVEGGPPAVAAASGLAAAAYLVLRYAADGPVGPAGAVGPTRAQAVLATGFAVVAALAGAVPGQLRWLPLAAPLAVVAGYLIALHPFVRAARPGD